jgi:esterase/lipase superfamily enzyme
MDGHYDDNVYFNCPLDYVPNLNDPWFLDRYRNMRIVLAAGDEGGCRDENSRMAGIFYEKGIPYTLDIWTGGERDDWPLWERMAVKFF